MWHVAGQIHSRTRPARKGRARLAQPVIIKGRPHMISRRGMLGGLASMLAAPAIVHAGNLMPIKRTIPAWVPMDGRMLDRYEYKELFAAVKYGWGGFGDKFQIPNFKDVAFAFPHETPSGELEKFAPGTGTFLINTSGKRDFDFKWVP
jgi:hypothetical protein